MPELETPSEVIEILKKVSDAKSTRTRFLPMFIPKKGIPEIEREEVNFLNSQLGAYNAECFENCMKLAGEIYLDVTTPRKK